MIYLCGDTHGGIDLRKLTDKRLEKLKRSDYVIICGDFGFVYDWKKESRKERSWLEWFSKQPYTTLFVDGNHECFPRLYAYPEKEWNGGKVRVIRDSVLYLERGQVFTIDEQTFFTMGGASSHDRGPAVGDTSSAGKYWWPEEIPSEGERNLGLENLQKHANHVDYILTHCLPASLQKSIKPEYPVDDLNVYLETVMNTVHYTHWYCGHYHMDQDIPHNVSILFNRLCELGFTVSCSPSQLGQPIYHKQDWVCFLEGVNYREGMITGVYPWGWGSAGIKDQPAYELMVNNKKYGIMKEKDIIGYGMNFSSY